MPLAGRPMVEWSIAACRAAGSCARSSSPARRATSTSWPGSDLGVVDGGATRAQSVSNALAGGRDRAGRDPRRGAAAGHAGADRGRGRDPGRRPRGRRRDRRHPGHRHDQAAVSSDRRRAFPTSWHGKCASASSEATLDRSGSGRRRRRRSSGSRRCARRWRPTPSSVAAATDEAMLVEAVGGGC